MIEDIRRFIEEYVEKYQSHKGTATAWEKPLVAFAGARDPLFAGLKTAVSPSHAVPQEILSGAQTVITYFIPFKKEFNLSNTKGREASFQWAVAYIETNRLIVDLNQSLAQRLKEWGYLAAVIPPTHNFDKIKLMSQWSHKHVAYIAGLGKFGLHRMLITQRGCSGRLGSLVTDVYLEPTPRPEGEFCLYKHNGSCSLCVQRCPGGALTVDSYDRHKCYDICLENAQIHENIGLTDVCGKCCSSVPCSFRNPVNPPLQRVQKFFATLPFPLEIILFDECTSTSFLAARALGVEVGQIAKTLVFKGRENGETPKENLIIVTSGDVKVNTKKIRDLVGYKPRFANGEEALAITGYPPGGVCPFGLPPDLPVFIDVSMNRFPVVYAAAGTDNSAVPITVEQLLQATGGRLCDVCSR